ncbi:hypothetical protein AVEN_256082-1 [Araneus ventricosus]|uniref:Uncharacterized protein n=1 Tax=Araneus ventricosus TaxID=182803 RepID=A0A4Y2D5I5_ARAVE|nr:hypothetical protein AVEN_256082-1 [Araneus ventricosus]
MAEEHDSRVDCFGFYPLAVLLISIIQKLVDRCAIQQRIMRCRLDGYWKLGFHGSPSSGMQMWASFPWRSFRKATNLQSLELSHTFT